MKTQNLFMTMMFLFLTLVANAQENQPKIWGELIYENRYGASFNLKNNQLIYRVGYMHYQEPDNYGIISTQHQFNKLDAGIDYVLLTSKSNKIDYSVGGSLAYFFGTYEEDKYVEGFGFFTLYEASDYSSFGGTVDAKANYYFSKYVGVGVGLAGNFAKNYAQPTGQVRILIGRLR